MYVGRYGLVRRVLRALGTSFWTPVLARLCMTAFTYTQPLLLERVIDYVNDPKSSDDIGYGLIGAYSIVYTGLAVSVCTCLVSTCIECIGFKRVLLGWHQSNNHQVPRISYLCHFAKGLSCRCKDYR